MLCQRQWFLAVSVKIPLTPSDTDRLLLSPQNNTDKPVWIFVVICLRFTILFGRLHKPSFTGSKLRSVVGTDDMERKTSHKRGTGNLSYVVEIRIFLQFYQKYFLMLFITLHLINNVSFCHVNVSVFVLTIIIFNLIHEITQLTSLISYQKPDSFIFGSTKNPTWPAWFHENVFTETALPTKLCCVHLEYS